VLFNPSNERNIPHYLIICSHSTALARDKMVQRKIASFFGNNKRKSESHKESSSAKQQRVISLESQSAGASSASQSAGAGMSIYGSLPR
jgi:hypothetical protein